MRFAFLQTAVFIRDARRLGLEDEDLRRLELMILSTPSAGDVMAGTGGVRKVRYAPAARRAGKSGGVRVCYVLFLGHDTVIWLTAFAKNEQANLTAAERREVRGWVTAIGRELDAGR